MAKSQRPVTIDERYRTLLILWVGMCFSLVIFWAFIHLMPSVSAPNQKLTLLLNTAGLIPVATSFLIKQVMIGKAIENQRVEQVHTANILAWAFCEIAYLLAFFDNRVTGSSYYYVGFAIAGMGMLLNFPRKQPLLDASQGQF